MNSLFLVYKTDNQHSYASRDVIGVASSKQEAINLVIMQATKEHARVNKNDLHNLNNLQQTQGYKGDGEFSFESIELDVLQ